VSDTEELLVIYVTAPAELAPKIAKTVVSERLAACVNIVPKIRSIYQWEEKLQDDEEALMIIKTRTSRFDALAEAIRREHSYDVPEIIGVPVSHAQADYQAWLLSAVDSGPRAEP